MPSSPALIFFLLSEACENQYDDSYKVWQHLEYLLHGTTKPRYIEVEDIQGTKEERSPDGVNRLPQCKDNKGDGQPASVTETVVGPCTA